MEKNPVCRARPVPPRARCRSRSPRSSTPARRAPRRAAACGARRRRGGKKRRGSGAREGGGDDARDELREREQDAQEREPHRSKRERHVLGVPAQHRVRAVRPNVIQPESRQRHAREPHGEPVPRVSPARQPARRALGRLQGRVSILRAPLVDGVAQRPVGDGRGAVQLDVGRRVRGRTLLPQPPLDGDAVVRVASLRQQHRIVVQIARYQAPEVVGGLRGGARPALRTA